MNRTTLLMAAASLGLVACGGEMQVDLPLEQGVSESAIINGDLCSEDTEPTSVAILMDALVQLGGFGEQEMKSVVCTGTLIAPDTVLTAAHCVDPETLVQSLTFGFGEIERLDFYISFAADLTGLAQQDQSAEFPPDAVKALDTIVHPNFSINNLNGQNVNGPGNFHDVGLIFLETPVEDVQPEVVVTLDEADQISEGMNVVIAGWGQQVQTSGPFEAPPAGSVGAKVCAESFVNEVGSHEMQIGGDASTSRKCHGDSGGPTYAVLETDFDNDRRVIGITSHAYDAEDCNKGGVDTRVDAFLEWIDAEMVSRCDSEVRSWCEVDGIVPPAFYESGGPDIDPANFDDPSAPQGCSSTTVSGSASGALPIGLALFGLLFIGRRRR